MRWPHSATARLSSAEIGGDAAIYADAADLATAIRALGADPRRLAVLGEAARQRAAGFDPPKIGRLVDTMRARIVAEGPPRL